MYSSPVRHFTSVLLRLLVRLACVKRAASVRSEPGSNSQVKLWYLDPRATTSIHLIHSLYSVFKEHRTSPRGWYCTSPRTLLSSGLSSDTGNNTRDVHVIAQPFDDCQDVALYLRKYWTVLSPVSLVPVLAVASTKIPSATVGYGIRRGSLISGRKCEKSRARYLLQPTIPFATCG